MYTDSSPIDTYVPTCPRTECHVLLVFHPRIFFSCMMQMRSQKKRQYVSSKCTKDTRNQSGMELSYFVQQQYHFKSRSKYRVVQKNCPLFKNSRPYCCHTMGPAMHSPIGHFRKVLAQFSQLRAISFAQPCTCTHSRETNILHSSDFHLIFVDRIFVAI